MTLPVPSSGADTWSCHSSDSAQCLPDSSGVRPALSLRQAGHSGQEVWLLLSPHLHTRGSLGSLSHHRPVPTPSPPQVQAHGLPRVLRQGQYSHVKSANFIYLNFQTKNIRRAPFYILSIGNAVLMIVVMILHDLCDYNNNCSHSFTKVTPVTCEWIIIMISDTSDSGGLSEGSDNSGVHGGHLPGGVLHHPLGRVQQRPVSS